MREVMETWEVTELREATEMREVMETWEVTELREATEMRQVTEMRALAGHRSRPGVVAWPT